MQIIQMIFLENQYFQIDFSYKQEMFIFTIINLRLSKIKQIRKSSNHWIIIISLCLIKLFMLMSSFKKYDK